MSIPNFDVYQHQTHNLFMAGTSEPGTLFLGWLAKTVDEHWPSRRKFCEESGIDPGGFSKLLNGQSAPEPPTLRRIADALLAKELIASRSELATRALFPEDEIDADGEAVDDLTARYRRALQPLTQSERQIVVDMLEFAAQRLLEARGRHPRGRAMTDAEVDADPAWQQLKEDFESLSPAERDEIIAYGHRLLLEQPKRKKPKSG
jgi:transcriptional regulator with XRE-family HTH domain